MKADHHLQQHQRQAWERLKWGDILQICNENKVNGTGEKGHMLKKDVLIGKLIARHIAVPNDDSEPLPGSSSLSTPGTTTVSEISV